MAAISWMYVCMLLFLIPNSLSLRSDALITRVSSMCIVVSSYYIIIFSIRIIVNVRSSSSASISSFIPVLLINIISSEAPSPLPPCIQHQISQEQPYRCLLHHHLIRNTWSPFQLFFCLLFDMILGSVHSCMRYVRNGGSGYVCKDSIMENNNKNCCWWLFYFVTT